MIHINREVMDQVSSNLPEISCPDTNWHRIHHLRACLDQSLRPGVPKRPKVDRRYNSTLSYEMADELETALIKKQMVAKTVNYLAYGSNLSAETFLGRRGIKPISQLNVCVPILKLTFDLPGIPYIEPCFANTARRDTNPSAELVNPSSLTNDNEKTALADALNASSSKSRYHKDRWHKPLVGVLYELTVEDFVHVIATEGGGAGYSDIIVDCYPLHDSATTVPMHPDTQPVKAHTLFSSTQPPPIGDKEAELVSLNSDAAKLQRPDPSYAQPSSRYLKLITDGAREHNLPEEYRDYLAQIRPFKITTTRQWFGQLITAVLWVPFLKIMMAFSSQVQDDKGRAPEWFVKLFNLLFLAIWTTYDGFFRKSFGDGERSIDNDCD